MRFAGREAGLVEAGLVGLEAKKVRSPDSAAGFSLFGFEVRNLPLLFQRILDAESKLAKSTACHSMHLRI